ncbi:response regulator [Geodermatophilus sp. SYSU D01062]
MTVPESPPDAAIRVLLVEDHQVVAESLAALLAEYPDLDVLGWVPTVAAAVEAVQRSEPDVVLVDFRLPDGSGAQAAARIRELRPHAAVVFLSADSSDDAVTAAVEAGAAGYLLKSAPSDDLVRAIHRAADGEILIPAQRLAELLTRRRAIARQRARHTRLGASLTPREREVLGLMARGMDNRALARHLGIEYSTVRSHVHKVLLKLDARSMLEAVAKATESGIVPTPRSPGEPR